MNTLRMKKRLFAVSVFIMSACVLLPRAASAEGAHGERNFIGNTKSKKVHTASCRYAKKTSEENRHYFSSYEEAVRAGFSPCKTCKPDRKVTAAAAGGPRFIGQTRTKKVHLSDCKYAQKIFTKNRVFFSTYQEAVDAGFVPCKDCAPDRWAAEAARARAAADAAELKRFTSDKPFIGHSVSKKVHRAECEWAKKILEKNRAYFPSYEKAASLGYEPCKVCKPDRAAGEKKAAEAAAAPFIGHSGSKKVHTAECRYARKMAPSKRVPFASYSAAVIEGYTPCKVCKPDLAGGGGKGAAAESKEREAPAEYLASRKGKTFHRPDCTWVKRIAPHNLAHYKTRNSALAAGKKPCRICNP